MSPPVDQPLQVVRPWSKASSSSDGSDRRGRRDLALHEHEPRGLVGNPDSLSGPNGDGGLVGHHLCVEEVAGADPDGVSTGHDGEAVRSPGNRADVLTVDLDQCLKKGEHKGQREEAGLDIKCSRSRRIGCITHGRNLLPDLAQGKDFFRIPYDLQLRMLTARAPTTAMVASDATDCSPIRILARLVKGNTSVGLNAVEFVSDR